MSSTVTATADAATIVPTATAITTKIASASGDPHFTVPLVSSSDTLCYSIQGYAGLAFNLISNSHLTVNALFTDSINDTKEVTWISKLAVIFHTIGQAIIFDSTHQQVFMPSDGRLKSSVVKQIILKESGQFAAKFTKGLRPKNGTNSVEVVYKENMAKFTVTFHNDHLDVDWQLQDEQIIHSHGLMGQFMAKGIVVDQMKQILIRPDHPPVPVRLHHIWDYTHSNTDQLPSCWLVVNDGIQGEGLIDGNILDYVVDDLLQEPENSYG
ncbi:inter-alpha-trypsin inhibitor heavy chain H3-like [Dysidea avara]|uniref:inter-alpha-trypsin inhibitor heavy chain H3-like n=1 Tax=Dysidea avara TaxID=196820 RepID=UPI00331B876D